MIHKSRATGSGVVNVELIINVTWPFVGQVIFPGSLLQMKSYESMSSLSPVTSFLFLQWTLHQGLCVLKFPRRTALSDRILSHSTSASALYHVLLPTSLHIFSVIRLLSYMFIILALLFFFPPCPSNSHMSITFIYEWPVMSV